MNKIFIRLIWYLSWNIEFGWFFGRFCAIKKAMVKLMKKSTSKENPWQTNLCAFILFYVCSRRLYLWLFSLDMQMSPKHECFIDYSNALSIPTYHIFEMVERRNPSLSHQPINESSTPESICVCDGIQMHNNDCFHCVNETTKRVSFIQVQKATQAHIPKHKKNKLYLNV